MAKPSRLPTQEADFPGWYNAVVREAGLAENGLAKGSMIIKPYGYAIWEFIQRALDDRFKATGHENLYFPLLFPVKLFEAEASHVEGFAPEIAVVTHGGGQKLEEPLAIRPTSEAIIWDTYSRWIQSYRDLPLLYNQWANVLRWEMRTRLFLRTSEFLWQEGHTAHSTEREAYDEAVRMQEVYREVIEDVCGMPALRGRKSASERFAGAVETFTLEAMMRDTKALQAGTSHFLGQNFSKAYNVQFLNKEGTQEYAWGTSWGCSTRTVGGVIMTHGDDNGLRLPPKIAPVQVVIVPIYKTDEEAADVLDRANQVRDILVKQGVRVKVDDRDHVRPGFKFSEWELKGVPLRIEVGPRDVAADQLTIADRVSGEKTPRSTSDAVSAIPDLLEASGQALRDDALAFRERNTRSFENFGDMAEGIAAEGGFWVGAWCGEEDCERKVTEKTKATIRTLPLETSDPGAPCVVCGKSGEELATWGRVY
ncbi:MAG: proline--tRNA ligase [Actinomycetota bacterium]